MLFTTKNVNKKCQHITWGSDEMAQLTIISKETDKKM